METDKLFVIAGGFSEGDTPGPIPNPAVKPLCADGTWAATPWESRSLPASYESASWSVWTRGASRMCHRRGVASPSRRRGFALSGLVLTMPRPDKRSGPLRVYHYVFGLDHLHYGLWEKEDAFSVEGLKAAQQRFEDYLVDRLPAGAESVLDVGCGTGMLSARLASMGLHVEGLAPYPHERELYERKLDVPYHMVRFQHFESEPRFDCVVMSESAQYIPPPRLFAKAAQCLKPGGHLMVCDFFVLDHAEGIMGEAGHNLTAFRAEAGRHGFGLESEADITDCVTPTLDLAKHWADKALLAADILSETVRDRHPWLTRLVAWRTRKKVVRLKQEMRLLDSKEFSANKRYLFLLYRKTGPSVG